MPTFLRNTLAVVGGFILGALVNSALVAVSPMLIPPPAGVDATNPESLAAGIHLFEPRHFLMPFLAHALGTLVGAFAAYKLAATRPAVFAYAIGVLFLAGGIAASLMIPAPKWFIALDLLAAYLPMAWLAMKLATKLGARSAPSST